MEDFADPDIGHKIGMAQAARTCNWLSFLTGSQGNIDNHWHGCGYGSKLGTPIIGW